MNRELKVDRNAIQLPPNIDEADWGEDTEARCRQPEEVMRDLANRLDDIGRSHMHIKKAIVVAVLPSGTHPTLAYGSVSTIGIAEHIQAFHKKWLQQHAQLAAQHFSDNESKFKEFKATFCLKLFVMVDPEDPQWNHVPSGEHEILVNIISLHWRPTKIEKIAKVKVVIYELEYNEDEHVEDERSWLENELNGMFKSGIKIISVSPTGGVWFISTLVPR